VTEMTNLRLSLEELKKFLPHRDPFLFIDEVIDLHPGKSIVAEKYFSGEEEFFRGHFPGRPILPGVIIIETAAQISALIVLTIPAMKNFFGLFTGVEKFRFIKKVLPATKLTVKAKMIYFRHNLAKSEAQIFAGDELVAEGLISAVFTDRSSM
jgi:3-hydroxyacyl-[acyl-carrier-protein] dehydratase